MPVKGLTAKQERFCVAYAVERMSQRQAYIEAFGRGNKTDKSIDELASRLVKSVKMQSRCEELRKKLENAVIWSKAEMIQDLRDIAVECKDAGSIETDEKGNIVRITNAKARAVAVNAIKTAGEFLGYKAAEKVEISAIEIIIKGGNSKYGE